MPSFDEITGFAKMSADHGADAIAFLDPELRILWVNVGFERLTGHYLTDIIGKKPDQFLHSSDTPPEVGDEFESMCRSNRPFVTEHEFLHTNGHRYWMENCVTPIFHDDGTLRYLLCNSRETTARQSLSQRLKKSIEVEKNRQGERRLLSQVSEWLYSSKSLDELLRVVNKSLSVLMPEASGQLFVYSNSRDVLDLQTSWGQLDKTAHIDAEDCWSLRRGRAYSYGTKSIEFPCQHIINDGVETPYFCLPIIAHGQTNGLLHLRFKSQAFENSTPEQTSDFLKQRWQMALLCAEQISLALANVQLRQELMERSVRDPLTGLWNRRWLLETAYKELKFAEKKRHPMSVLSLDVDHFKKFNDHHGHDAGDMILRALGNTMLEFFQTNASACRMGGEEFLILCPEIGSEAAEDLANGLRRRLTEINVNYGGTQLPKVTASIGVASYPKNATQLDELLMCADKAMYQAKENGRDQVVTYVSEPTPRLREGRHKA